jgi:hypothetical protein
MKQREVKSGITPFSAKSSSSTITCQHCHGIDFRVMFEYRNIYRNRCKECNEMFDSDFNHVNYCNDCYDKQIERLANLGL